MNRVLGRDAQSQFETSDQASMWNIPGRTLILKQNKVDMGAHRFTFVDKNTLVAATDMPGSNDLEHVNDEKAPIHYSKVHQASRMYGVKNVYTHKAEANEDIRIIVEHVDPEKTKPEKISNNIS